MKSRRAQVIGVTLALFVSVMAVAGPLLALRCETMRQTRAGVGSVACSEDADRQVGAACSDMRQATPVAATIAPKAPTSLDLFALAPTAVALPAVVTIRGTYAALIDEPPRLVLDTSRLRI